MNYKQKIYKTAAYLLYVAALFVASALAGVVVKVLCTCFMFGYDLL